MFLTRRWFRELNTPWNWKPGPAAERFLREWGDASPEGRFRPGAGDDALASSPAGLYGASPARRRDAGLGRRGLFSYCWWHIFRLSPVPARRFTGVANTAAWRRRCTAVGLRVPYSCVPASAILVTFIVLRADCQASRGRVLGFASLAAPHHPLTVPSGVWNQPTTSGRFLLFVPAGPTSPAHSWRHGVRTEPGCFADRSFSTQAYKPRVLTDITCLRVAVPKTSFFCCLPLSSIRVSRSFPHRLADVRISVSTSCTMLWRRPGVPEDGSGRGCLTAVR